jgi:hypothetical protein
LRSCGAILLAEDGGTEIIEALFKGEHNEPRFRGIGDPQRFRLQGSAQDHGR